jgi:small Trp-rich protein
MPFVIVGAILLALKLLEYGPVANWSWWIIIAPLACAVLWFEGLERIFGFDQRKKEHAMHEKIREERLEKAFAKPGKKRS